MKASVCGVVLMMLFVSALASAAPAKPEAKERTVPVQSKTESPLSSKKHNDDLDRVLVARSGCCSHHGGVCGCSGDTIMCCDGTASPSCTCTVY